MRFSTLNLLDGEPPGYFGHHFYLDYMVTCLTIHCSLVYKHTNIGTCVCVFMCCAKQRVFHVFVHVYNSN
jgi:hypothetical protein